jgi:NAD(P)-dependent dehydrogenase (short-subunit alcohol dehydrogenase family)
VTGASGAFGTAARAELRRRGWRVAGLDLSPDPADDEVLACDVTDDQAVPAAVAEAIERLGGGLDVLLNNAGIGGPASAGAPPGDHVRRMLDVNLLGACRSAPSPPTRTRCAPSTGRMSP